MELNQDATYLLAGAAIGFTSSTVGAILDYLASRRRQVTNSDRKPGCMLPLSGLLGFIGLVVTILSFILSGKSRPSLLAGIGVVGSFSLTFIILTLGWLFITNRRARRTAGNNKKPTL